MTYRISFFLVPRKKEEDFYRKWIQRLAQKFDGPLFDPHVTLHVAFYDEAQLAPLLDQAAAACPPFTTTISNLKSEPIFNRALYTALMPHSHFEELGKILAGPGRQPAHYDPKRYPPHISLYYGNQVGLLRSDEKQELMQLTSVSFDRIRAVRIPMSVASNHDVEAFATVAERKLLSPSR